MITLRKASFKRIKEAILSNNLSSHGEGWGSGSLNAVENGDKIYGGCVVKDGAKEIGWGFAVDDSEFGPQKIHIYVIPAYRRKGIGTRIYRFLKRHHKEFNPVPWDFKSRAFYNKNGS